MGIECGQISFIQFSTPSHQFHSQFPPTSYTFNNCKTIRACLRRTLLQLIDLGLNICILFRHIEFVNKCRKLSIHKIKSKNKIGSRFLGNFCKNCGDCDECGENKYFTAFLTKIHRKIHRISYKNSPHRPLWQINVRNVVKAVNAVTKPKLTAYFQSLLNLI